MKTALTVAENLRFWQRFLRRGRMSPWRGAGDGRPGAIGAPAVRLSVGRPAPAGGDRQAAGRYRPVWLLDEPTAGLDAASEAQFSALMQAHLDEGGIIVAATHLPLGLRGRGS